MSTFWGYFKFIVGGVPVEFETRVRYQWTPEGPEIEQVVIIVDLDHYELAEWGEAAREISDRIRRERNRSAA